MSKQNENSMIDAGNGEYAVRRNRRGNIIAAVLCALLAVVIWAIVMNAQDSEKVALALPEPQEGYVYTLSETTIEVRGKVMDLKRTDTVRISVPEAFAAEGSYTLNSEHLVLPEGISPVAAVEITLTVTKAAK